MERVFDICHGCRRCVSLCQSFPTLFDLIDATADGEVHGVDKKDYGKVVDQCYLCDLCYMTKCPYVPPHPWNVDFPHLMLRAKAIQLRQGRGRRRRQAARLDRRARPARRHPDRRPGGQRGEPREAGAQGARRRARRPSRRLAAAAGDDGASAARSRGRASGKVVDGERSPGKVALFATCYVNYNEPGIGHDLVAVLEHNEIAYELVEKESCCGMPKLELGDLEGVAKLKEKNIPVLARYAREGFAILTAIPSCTLMFKQELPLMFPDDADVKAVQEAMFDPFEYLSRAIATAFSRPTSRQPLGKVSYHVPCHGRVQKIGRKTEEMLKLIGKTVAVELTTVERCSGHAGTYGVKTEDPSASR